MSLVARMGALLNFPSEDHLEFDVVSAGFECLSFLLAENSLQAALVALIVVATVFPQRQVAAAAISFRRYIPDLTFFERVYYRFTASVVSVVNSLVS